MNHNIAARIPILLIDDDEADRYLTRRVCRRSGMGDSVVEASQGEVALEILQDESKLREMGVTAGQPLLILLDINMPKMNGFEVLDELRPLFEAGKVRRELIRLYMYSSSNSPSDRARSHGYDWVEGYLVKPLTSEQLCELV